MGLFLVQLISHLVNDHWMLLGQNLTMEGVKRSLKRRINKKGV